MPTNVYTTQISELYGAELSSEINSRLVSLVHQYKSLIPISQNVRLSEADSILITYADQVQEEGQRPLHVLADFMDKYLQKLISGIHVLPFYPWSSDDGFSVIDYLRVDDAFGDWNHIERIGSSYRLMVDLVINHVSAQSEWFQSFLKGVPPYDSFFMTVEGDPDLSKVVRPRTLPLLTEYHTAQGTKRVWTTFSPDQVDLNYHNPDVLLKMMEVLFTYIQHGAQVIRLDAIAYLWKEIGTSCIHLPQTHQIIQLIRKVLDDVAPHVILVTETNVPHVDNISYFGDGFNEAQMVYNFALPPLVMHTIHTGNASRLTDWAKELALPSDRTTFFNFLASHDGIGINPARGILTDEEIQSLIDQTKAHGGLVSYKSNPDGTESPYELNISYFDALSDPGSHEPVTIQVGRFLAAQAIMLSLLGVPGIYFHSLVGSRNWLDGVGITKQNRTINRQKLDGVLLENQLKTIGSIRNQVFTKFRKLLAIRSSSSAFDPYGSQKVLDMGPAVFAVLRISPDGQERMLCIQNVTPSVQQVSTYLLEPYETLWLKPENHNS